MEGVDVIAYTDGGCRGNPGGIGGWAFLLVHPRTGKALERAGGERETTNNRMEMTAAIEALGAIRRHGLVVVVRSDSRYLIDCCSKWLPGWKRRGWRRSEGPLKNVDLLQALDELMARQRVSWQWIRAHAGERGNERVDRLANEAMDRIARGADPRAEKRRTWKVR